MKKAIVAVVGLCALFAAGTSYALPACVWPTYENTVRQWGVVTDVALNLAPIPSWVMVKEYTSGAYVYVNCGASPALTGCNLLSIGDSILISGHSETYPSTSNDNPSGVGNYATANVIYRCQGHVPGTCLQVTPCS